MRRVLLTIALLLLGCGGDGAAAAGPSGQGGQGAGGQGAGGAGGGPVCAESDNDAIRLALAPTCEACHKATSGKPFFASLQAFETLLAYNEAYVVRGKPDESKLVALLTGKASGSYAQMPLAGDPFSELEKQGKTQISVQKIRDWITALPQPSSAPVTPDPTAPSTRRLSAEEFLRALEAALGYATQTGGVPPLLGGSMQPLSPDSPRGVDYNDGRRRELYKLLGGASYLEGRPAEKTWSPSSLAVVSQIALRECGRAVKDGSKAIFAQATAADKLPEGEAAIRKNIAAMHRRFLGLGAADADVDALLTQVFVPASARGVDVAWVEVCTALIRHPYFVTF